MRETYRTKSNYWLRREIARMERAIYRKADDPLITAMTNELHRRGKLTHFCK